MSTALPTALCVIFGKQIVSQILAVVPKWFTNGLSIAGSLLPVVGIVLLLQVMPVKKYLSMLILGYVLSGYLNMPILGVSLVGLALAYYYFTTNMEKSAAPATDNGAIEEDGDDFDE